MSRTFLLSAAITAALIAGPALAHPKLLSAAPAADAAAAPTAKVEIHFSEKLVASFSGIDLEMTDMPGMKMRQRMKMPVVSSVAADGTTLVGTLPKLLPRGGYRLDYHAVSTDTHRVEGGYAFTVK